MGSNFSWKAVAGIIVSLAIAVSIHLLDVAPGLQPTWSYDTNQWESKLMPKQQSSLHYDMKIVRFIGGDGVTELVGRLYRPHHDPTHPRNPAAVIVLAHGLGLTQDCGLEPFVRAYTRGIEREAYAAFTFDYATFGASGGIPRHVVHPKNHIADLEAAIAILRKRGDVRNNKHYDQEEVLEGIDIDRIGLWGTSLGGGHVLAVAGNYNQNLQDIKKKGDANNTEEDNYLKAVVTLVPAVASATESVIHNFDKNTMAGIAKITQALIKWAAVVSWSKFFGSCYQNSNESNWYVPLSGLPGSHAMMQNPGDDKGYSSLIDGDNVYGWKNAATAMSAVRVLFYRPMNWLASLQQPTSSNNNATPILMIAAEKDTLCPLEFINKAFRMISSSVGSSTRKLVVLKDAGHFDVYSNSDDRKLLQQVLAETLEFFQDHL